VVIGGNISTTRDIILSWSKIVGLIDGISKVTSLMLMSKWGQVVWFSDCAVINNPTSEELCEITHLSSCAFEKITGRPAKIGLLSFATKGSAITPEVEKVQNAVSLIHSKYPSLQVDWPLQFDAAFSPRVAAIKAPNSAVAGEVNLFIFPTLDAGNIGYKIAEQFWGYQAIGPILLGTRKPYLDLSRGCSAQDIAELARISTLL
jgi:phosphate acetyltransferase